MFELGRINELPQTNGFEVGEGNSGKGSLAGYTVKAVLLTWRKDDFEAKLIDFPGGRARDSELVRRCCVISPRDVRYRSLIFTLMEMKIASHSSKRTELHA